MEVAAVPERPSGVGVPTKEGAEEQRLLEALRSKLACDLRCRIYALHSLDLENV